MSTPAIRLQLYIGPQVPVPAPAALTAALDSAQVTCKLDERTGFELVFKAPYADLMGPLFTVFNRVILVAYFGAQGRVLVDGFITQQSHEPAGTAGLATLTLTGEDISLAMDREDRRERHTGQSDAVIAAKLILRYSLYGLLPVVIPPELSSTPSPSGSAPFQTGSDLDYLNELAERHAFVFRVIPGPVVYTNTGYWGPSIRLPIPQPALSTNLEAFSNVDSIKFQHNSLATRTHKGPVQDKENDQIGDVMAAQSIRQPLAAMPDWLTHADQVRSEAGEACGPTLAESQERTRGKFERSIEKAITASGELDTPRYGHILEVGGLVGVRGAGILYDGLYLVREVTHILKRGSYKQRFTLGREGLGSTIPVVVP